MSDSRTALCGAGIVILIKEGVIISDLKIKEKPFAFTIAETLMEHPFLLTAAACFFCITTVSSKISWLGSLIPAAVLCMCGIFAAICISFDAPEKSRKSIIYTLSGISAAFSLIFAYMLRVSRRPQMVVLNIGIIIFAAVVIYLFATKKMNTKRLILLLFILGFLIRLAYIMAVSIKTKQHDVGSLEKLDGHLGYIGYLVYNNKLPEGDVRDVYQYYHPPLHHIIAAIWVRFQNAIGIEKDNTWENIQILTMFYSCCCMILSYKIFRQLGLKNNGLVIAFAVVTFCPTFYILSGSINNDILSITLMLGAVLNTLYWYKSRSIWRILCIAACVGFGMMAKLSAWMVAPAIAFVFLYVLFKNLKEWKKYLAQFAAFMGVCAPLGLWWGVRNYITHRVPITYVMELSSESKQYIGDIPLTKRLFDFSLYQFADVGDQFGMYEGTYNEFNPLIALFKTSMFDEMFTVHYYPDIAGINKVLFWSAVVLGIVGFVSMIYCLINDKTWSRMHKIFLGILYFTILISYYAFCIKFPHVCTQNIRYAVLLIVIGAYFIGRLAQNLCESESEKTQNLRIAGYTCLLTVVFIYSAISVVVYDVIFMT